MVLREWVFGALGVDLGAKRGALDLLLVLVVDALGVDIWVPCEEISRCGESSATILGPQANGPRPGQIKYNKFETISIS